MPGDVAPLPPNERAESRITVIKREHSHPRKHQSVLVKALEVAGLVVGIVSLYSACQQCYNLFSDVENAGKETTLAARELDIHSSILKAWAFYWEINPAAATARADSDGREESSEKLDRYLRQNPYKAMGIATALQCIGDVLSDKQKLLTSYGLDVNLEDVNLAASPNSLLATLCTSTADLLMSVARVPVSLPDRPAHGDSSRRMSRRRPGSSPPEPS